MTPGKDGCCITAGAQLDTLLVANILGVEKGEKKALGFPCDSSAAI